MRSNKKKITSARLLVLVLMLTAVVFGPLIARADNCAGSATGVAGHTKGEATELTGQGNGTAQASECVGQISGGVDSWYKITFRTPTAFLLQFSLGGTNTTLYSPTNQVIEHTTLNGGADGPEWSIRAMKGTWYLRIQVVSYPVYDFRFATLPQSDCGVTDPDSGFGVDASNSATTPSDGFAQGTGEPVGCKGQVWGSTDPANSVVPHLDPDDWYSLPDQVAGTPMQLRIVVAKDQTFGCQGSTRGFCGSPDTTGVKVEFRDSAGKVIPDSNGNASTSAAENAETSITFIPPKDGSYKIHFSSNGDYIYGVNNTTLPDTNVVTNEVGILQSAVASATASATSIASATATASAVQSQLASATATASTVTNLLGSPGLANTQPDCGAPSSGDAGNTSATATLLTPNVVPIGCPGTLGRPGDNDDWYVFNIAAGQQLGLLVSGDGFLDPNIKLYDPAGHLAHEGVNAGPMPEYFGPQNITAGGNWKLQIHRQASAGTYLLLMDVRALPTDVSAVNSQVAAAESTATHAVPSNLPGTDSLKGDCETANDAGNTSTNPWKIQPNNGCTGLLGVPATDTDDWYSFQGDKGQTIGVLVGSETSLEQDVFLWNTAGQRIWPPSHFDTPVPEYFTYTLTAKGTWKIQIHKVRGAGHYLFLLGNANSTSIGGVPTIPPTPNVMNPTSPDCSAGHDAPNSLRSARQISAPSQCVGSLGGLDNDDFYSFSARVGDHIIVQEQADPSLDADTFIYSPAGERTPNGPASQGVTPENIYMYANRLGVYTLRIHKAFGAGNYQFSLYVGT